MARRPKETKPLAWHQECLDNMRANLARDGERMQQVCRAYYRLEAEVFALANRINSAQARGQTELEIDP